MIATVAILFSGALLAALAARDPKRLRHAQRHVHPAARLPALTPAARRLCGWLVPLPGVLLAVFGMWWALLVWIGATTAFGWLTSHLWSGARTATPP